MKLKTINAVICKKFDEYLDSITNAHVRELVRKNTIITGGCIASMLLKEDVNDFDIYFTNHETALKVTQYYLDIWNKENPNNIGELDTTDSKRIKIVFPSIGIAADPEYTNDSIGEAKENFIEKQIITPEESVKSKFRPVFITQNAITLSDKIQIIIRYFGNVEEIHTNFDFIHCTNYWNSEKRNVVINQKALESLLTKELMYVGSKYPLCSVLRSRKFMQRGWTCNAGQLLKMMYQISKLNLDDIEVLEDQLVGVDTTYFSILIEALRNRDINAGKMNYGYLAEVIDRIF